MGFITAIKTCLGKYATFSGRAPRSEFWFFALFNLLANMVTAMVDAGVGAPFTSALFALAMLLPNLAVTVRRLHDLDRSGWWMLVFLIPLVGLVFYFLWTCSKGTTAPNRFGDDPLSGELAAVPA